GPDFRPPTRFRSARVWESPRGCRSDAYHSHRPSHDTRFCSRWPRCRDDATRAGYGPPGGLTGARRGPGLCTDSYLRRARGCYRRGPSFWRTARETLPRLWGGEGGACDGATGWRGGGTGADPTP